MPRGRPRKKPNVDTAKEIEEMVERACELLIEPYDDRKDRDASLPSMNEIAHEMGVTIIKLKRLLITGGYYSSATSRGVQKRVEGGQSMEQICEELEMSSASFYANIPYSKGVYNLKERSVCADQNVRFREREKALSALAAIMSAGNDCSLALWKTICAFEDYTFQTSGRGSKPGVKFKYEVSRSGGAGGRHYSGASVDGYGNELWVTTSDGQRKEKSISRSTVDRAFSKAREMEGCVSGPKKLGVPGAGSYLYAMFVRFGVINTADPATGAAEAGADEP